MGHGHVTPNADGTLARCGGPALCAECRREYLARYGHPFDAERPDTNEEGLQAENKRLRAINGRLLVALYEVATIGPNCLSCIEVSDIANKAIIAHDGLHLIERERLREAVIEAARAFVAAQAVAIFPALHQHRYLELERAIDALMEAQEPSP